MNSFVPCTNPDPRLEDVCLVLVHLNKAHNPDNIGEDANVKLASLAFGGIFEHQAHHQSRISHLGKIIDDEKKPGDYHLPTDWYSHYVLTGGGLGYCHYGAYLSLVSQHFNRTLEVHLPLDCVYKAEVVYDQEPRLVSLPVHFQDPLLKKYYSLLRISGSNYSLYRDGHLIEANNGRCEQRLYTWTHINNMLRHFENVFGKKPI